MFLLKEQLRWKRRKLKSRWARSAACVTGTRRGDFVHLSTSMCDLCVGVETAPERTYWLFFKWGEGKKAKKESTSKCREKSRPQPEKQTRGPHPQEDQKLSLRCKATEKWGWNTAKDASSQPADDACFLPGLSHLAPWVNTASHANDSKLKTNFLIAVSPPFFLFLSPELWNSKGRNLICVSVQISFVSISL